MCYEKRKSQTADDVMSNEKTSSVGNQTFMQQFRSHRKELKVCIHLKLLFVNLHRWQTSLHTIYLKSSKCSDEENMQELRGI